MMPCRVVAWAVACCLSLTTPMAWAVSTLTPLPANRLPDAAALLAPARHATWPVFIDPYRLDARTRRALASPQHMLAKPRPRLRGQPLPAVTRRHLARRIRKVLPIYDQLFRRAADDFKLPASLLAAQAYIESKWRPKARYRGVAGMMMLSATTARVVDVHNRLSASQSVRGGARYLDRIRARLPSSVPYPDRNLFALAAYNMGSAHLDDARTLARRLGKNPDLWVDLREVLPLMSKPQYYKQLPYGFVRGAHVVRYVDRIKRYQAIIAPHID